MSIFKKSKSKRTTFTGIEITEKKKHLIGQVDYRKDILLLIENFLEHLK